MHKGLKANLAPKVFASTGCIRHAQTFQILVIAQPYEQGARNQDIFAHGVEGCDGHAMGKKPRKIACTRMLCLSHSTASACVKLSTAPLEAS